MGQQFVALLLIWWEICSLEIACRPCVEVSEAVCLASGLGFRGGDFIVAVVFVVLKSPMKLIQLLGK